MPRKGKKVNPPAVSIEYDTTISPTATPKRIRKTKTISKKPAPSTPTTPAYTRHQEHEQPCSLEKEIVSKPRKSVCRTHTHEEEENLVAWLRENTFLYDKSSANFKLKEKNRTWAAKEKELGVKAGDLSSIWYPNMRTQFSKLVKLSSKSGSGVAEHTTRQQWLMDSFSLLRPYLVQLRNQRGSKFAEKELTSEDTDDIDALLTCQYPQPQLHLELIQKQLGLSHHWRPS
ncbi:unnamed protein product [Mytilus coruscus]|uniref:MADF domain-containing protein n=1 Tax=Mytilus coruscus TaxID=42192 RepID=A0A6J8D2P9_MYTCO|nr:unnamed protein product [Mytilus coruscus]